MRISRVILTGVILLLLGSTAFALAQTNNECSALSPSYDLSWWTVDGGGNRIGTGGYTLAGTVGQSDAGIALSNGGYSLVGGFWPGVTAMERYPLYLPLVLHNT
jgi:hypothetical protein